MQIIGARLPRSARLLTPAVFKRVFQRSKSSSDRFFTILSSPNELPQARLGMAIAKKNLKRAVDRNLVKRIVRESFRQHQRDLAGFDLVVLCRRDLPVKGKLALRRSLARHWKKVSVGFNES
ncbi:ribonuclease P protein component [Candidatus Vondammii sp. HM_W22]|uniref:ribonuclease P protein component n=1 Tax=Candidatus Vondammii sp. HM_W22 TaxID=2687299 RepID=UPI001F138B0B|nr:ribonuclease P protein component [Candidatus Vondammii sp. HM_W22]